VSTMRVIITDEEALRTLSWKAVKAYIEASGWHRARVIADKSVIYQHTDKDGRLWEIAVLLRDDLADYVSRMADAVGTLARVEDRSELDVYEDLRALGFKMEADTTEDAEPPPVVDESTRVVHQRIRKWLAEEDWHVRDVDDPQAIFNVMATLPNGPNVNIFQYKHHVDRITLSHHWLFDDEFRSAICQLPEGSLRDVVWTIYRDVTTMGAEFIGLDTPSTEMTIRAYVYFDGLTKDSFIQRTLLTIRALALAIRTFFRALEEHGRSSEVTAQLLRFVPPTDGPLTVAS
jgi:hypothetical protein